MTNDLHALVSTTLARSRARVADDGLRRVAEDAGHVDVALGTVATPIGELFVAVTPRGLACVAFEGEDREALIHRFASALSPRVLTAIRAIDEVRRQLDEYFEGVRPRFELRLDRRLMTPFAREVLDVTAGVPFGHLATYGAVAARIGRPQAARAVGAALGSNPIPVVVPCHRVVGASGALTGYAGGLDRKAFLLHLEGDPILPR